MAFEHFIVFGVEDGGERYRGMGRPGAAGRQELAPGLGAVAVPVEALAGPSVDLDIVRPVLLAHIDAEALARAGDPLALVHAYKSIDAEGYLANPQKDPGPFLKAEAEATGEDLGALAARILRNGELSRARMVAVETKRIAARRAVKLAETIGAMAIAAQVDWAD